MVEKVTKLTLPGAGEFVAASEKSLKLNLVWPVLVILASAKPERTQLL